jgi:hypothetical protein
LPDDLQDWQAWESEDLGPICWDDPVLPSFDWPSPSELDIYLDPVSNPPSDDLSDRQDLEVDEILSKPDTCFRPLLGGYDSPLDSPVLDSLCEGVEAMEL